MTGDDGEGLAHTLHWYCEHVQGDMHVLVRKLEAAFPALYQRRMMVRTALHCTAPLYVWITCTY